MCVCVLSVKLYEIMVGLVTSFGITGIGKGIVCLLIAYAVIDGPNLVERILGMDAGLSSSVGRAMALFGAGRAAGRKAVRGVKNTAMAAATGTTLRQRREKGTPGEQFGKGIHQRFHREEDEEQPHRQDARQQEQQFRQQEARSAQPRTAETPDTADEQTVEAAPAKPQPFPTDFMDAGTAGTSGGSNFGNSVPEVKKRVSNPAFSAAVKRLTPGPESSAEERKDFNRQVTAIVRGRKHRAIQPPVGADLYQVKNYEKALELEKPTPAPDRIGSRKMERRTSGMADNVTTQIESKTRVSRHINLSSLYFIVGYLMFAYMLKDFIYSLFFVPYMIFSLCCAVYLVLPSRYNKGRANWESIVVLLRADRAVYRPYAEQEVDNA